ncbi:hypothetical protein HDU87_007896 [Geranomyces variabilis]|uniref:Uncharacterized protein n=1 Tax=Geranomyces variabilis TaxID=109894 RepID=A0AAD5TFY5_9FUNG|nr:hypothetical protein HDU87_007896 [Geranomyces variabilis]
MSVSEALKVHYLTFVGKSLYDDRKKAELRDLMVGGEGSTEVEAEFVEGFLMEWRQKRTKKQRDDFLTKLVGPPALDYEKMFVHAFDPLSV